MADRGIRLECRNGHEQLIYTCALSEDKVRMLGELMDGTSRIYRNQSPVRCTRCNLPIRHSVFGFEPHLRLA